MARNRNALRSAMTSRSVRRRRRRRARRLSVLCCALLCAAIALGGINIAMARGTAGRILSPEEAAQMARPGGAPFDCILVLGAKVMPSGALSHMLEDRCRRGVALYEAKAAPVLLMSGDHGQVYYNEVSAMKQYAVEHGVPSSDVFMDHAGFSTYDSLYRARDIFQAKRVLIVTQRYHMFRALYIAKQLGLDAWGVTCDYRAYATQLKNSVRECGARIKAFFMCIFLPKPKYLGEAIPLAVYDGNVTND